MRRLFKILAVMALLIAVIGAGYYFTQSDPAPQARQKASVRLAWVYDMAEVGLFVAKDEGAFKRNGFDMTIEPGGFGLDPIKLVASGTNDFGVAGGGNLLLARAQGVPVVAIGAEFQDTPVGFIVRADSPIQSFADFRGRRVGIQTGTDTDVLYRALLHANGMTSADVREVPIQFDAGPFATGRIDVLPGYVTNQPITLRGNGIATRVVSAQSQGLRYYGNVYFTTERMIQEHPDRVRAFMAAARQGWERALADKNSAIAAVRARSPDFKPVDLALIYDAVVPFIKPAQGTPLLGMEQARWEVTRKVLTDAGMLDTQVDLSKAYTDAFLK